MPLVYLNTYLRLIRKKEDTDRYKERFGYTNFKQILEKDVIWIHASSVGEFKSCDFLINSFHKNYNLLITTTTKTAADYALKNYGEKIIHQYAPFDVVPWINKFLNFCVKKKIDFTFKSITLSQPFSEKLSRGSPHAAPALLTKKSMASSFSVI